MIGFPPNAGAEFRQRRHIIRHCRSLRRGFGRVGCDGSDVTKLSFSRVIPQRRGQDALHNKANLHDRRPYRHPNGAAADDGPERGVTAPANNALNPSRAGQLWDKIVGDLTEGAVRVRLTKVVAPAVIWRRVPSWSE